MKKRIDDSLQKIKFDRRNEEAVWERIHQNAGSGQPTRYRGRRKKRWIPILAGVLILSFAFAGIAMEIPQKLLALLEPVNQAVVQNGIELKVISAMADEDSMVIMYSLKDLEQNRITRNTSVDEFDLSNVSTLGTYQIDFDEETQTGLFCMAGNNGSNMKGQQVTLSIDSLSNHATNDYPTNLSIAELLKEQDQPADNFIPNDQEERSKRWNSQSQSGGEYQEEMNENDPNVLRRDVWSLPYPGLPWLIITNGGFQDGWLHLQIRYAPETMNQNYGYLYIAGQDGNQIEYPVLNQKIGDTHEEYMIRLDEQADLENLYLAARFTSTEEPIRGPWSTTFKIEGVKTKSWETNLTTGGLQINRITLSPLGVTIYGTGEPSDSLILKRTDQTMIEIVGCFASDDPDGSGRIYKYQFDEPEELEDLDTILINDLEIPIE